MASAGAREIRKQVEAQLAVGLRVLNWRALCGWQRGGAVRLGVAQGPGFAATHEEDRCRGVHKAGHQARLKGAWR